MISVKCREGIIEVERQALEVVGRQIVKVGDHEAFLALELGHSGDVA